MSGAAGASGSVGGSTGTSGVTGSAGAVTGVTGQTGSAGAVTGNAGATGFTGSVTGNAGATGFTGSVTGNAGATGFTGTVTGSTGVTGTSGVMTGMSGVGGTSGAAGASGQVSCGPQNCRGCCRNNQCLSGADVVNCGSNGQACASCGSNATCVAQGTARFCSTITACQSSCQGCCDANGQCQAGFLDGQCGQNGNRCVDCAGLGAPSTCNTNSMPRVCTSQQKECPAPYPGCPAGVTAAMPVVESACSMSDLQNADAACLAGAHTPGCQAFFQFEQSQNQACANCLSPFDFDFSEISGLIACLSPFVDPMCSTILGCLNDCENQSCDLCPDTASLQQCRTQAAASACTSFVSSANCIAPAFFGPGSFCNPNQGSFGAWLSAVGAHYCL